MKLIFHRIRQIGCIQCHSLFIHHWSDHIHLFWTDIPACHICAAQSLDHNIVHLSGISRLCTDHVQKRTIIDTVDKHQSKCQHQQLFPVFPQIDQQKWNTRQHRMKTIVSQKQQQRKSNSCKYGMPPALKIFLRGAAHTDHLQKAQHQYTGKHSILGRIDGHHAMKRKQAEKQYRSDPEPLGHLLPF